VRVELPSKFDSLFAIEKEHGNLKVHGLAAAYQLNVRSGGGSCDITASPAAVVTYVMCRGGSLSVTVPEIAPAGTHGSWMADHGVDLTFEGATRGRPFRLGLWPRAQYDVLGAEAAGCREGTAPPTLVCNGATVDDPLYTASVWESGHAQSTVRF
jgi:hypothetical protein